VTIGFPTSFRELEAWAHTQRVGVLEARSRFAQYGVLFAIASVYPLQRDFVFKGGNALDFVWLPNRSTVDLDFSLELSDAASDVNSQTIQTNLAIGLELAERSLGTR
jgi:predicted nucleotidyltransferase component of viral defense system